MKNLLALIGALVVGFAVAGWYLGWYQLGFIKTSDGNLKVETNVNTKKVVEDSSEALKKAGAFVGEHLGQAATSASESTNQPPASTPGPQDGKDEKDTKSGKTTLFGFELSPPSK